MMKHILKGKTDTSTQKNSTLPFSNILRSLASPWRTKQTCMSKEKMGLLKIQHNVLFTASVCLIYLSTLLLYFCHKLPLFALQVLSTLLLCFLPQIAFFASLLSHLRVRDKNQN
jgi:hypothetical protein